MRDRRAPELASRPSAPSDQTTRGWQEEQECPATHTTPNPECRNRNVSLQLRDMRVMPGVRRRCRPERSIPPWQPPYSFLEWVQGDVRIVPARSIARRKKMGRPTSVDERTLQMRPTQTPAGISSPGF